MSAPGKVAVDQGRSAAFVVTHTVKPGAEQRYEEWTREILSAVSLYPGYLGREVFLPAQGNRKYTIIVRFDDEEHLKGWADSDARRQFISRADDLLEKGDQNEIRTGVDFWFTPEGTHPPKAWKQFLLTASAVYPLSLILPRLLAPLYRVAPALGHPLISALLMAALLTGLLTFVIMPRYTRLVRGWLYKESE
ncbi:MAG TPA: antibiotic biosynthesis monooxygenase [Pyrinomonadaceae bacterium]|jgi:antibiotic biosynthesis monooxygenase (ABM) superfamily enzyme